MPRVVHFQMYVDDPERASKFYSEIFDWKITGWEGDAGFWLVNTGEDSEPGINGGMLRRSEPGPDPDTDPAAVIDAVNTAVNTIVMQVPSIDDYVPKITGGGGVLTVPKFAIPGVGYAAYFIDTEGNPIGIFQDDDTAA